MDYENFQHFNVNQSLIFNGIISKTKEIVSIEKKIKTILYDQDFKYYKFDDGSVWNTNPSDTTIPTRWQSGKKNDISKQKLPSYSLLYSKKSSTIIIYDVNIIQDVDFEKNDNFLRKYLKYKLKYNVLKKL
jgi:hypothetical protein